MTHSILIAFLLSIVFMAHMYNAQRCPAADNSCSGFGGGEYCNDRCKLCGYKYGGCGGLGWQVCQCYGTGSRQIEEPVVAAVDTPIVRGFGCPGNPERCHDHCKTIPGYKGGYCEAFLVCKCY